ncbi:cell wall metabolism sensor histidine kinase WalK [Streptomyces sp. NBRC 110028]|uniref:sensor histidine kinase n=1 Tax=Streptomyces sp. NBRC 110028 TaxID=1621260 RepID=UPI000A9A30E5|nr:HAMP domain-containing sensor histidine kinase [Streptomyces sp. NBRC 110028]
MAHPSPRGGNNTRAAARRPWSLRTRLVVSAVSLIAVVCAVIGTVTTIALKSYLEGQVDNNLRSSAAGAMRKASEQPNSIDPRGPESIFFLNGPGQPIGTAGARLGTDGKVIKSGKSNDEPLLPDFSNAAQRVDELTSGQEKALASVPRDDTVHVVDLPGLGSYRAVAKWNPRDGGIIMGFPLNQTEDTVNTLILVEVCVAAAGLVAAGLAGATMVGISLRPLRRVAATATRVSELPLHSGEVALRERVPASEADPRTEVGQVGAALNRMLGHIESALAARQESETRVRQFVADASHELRTPLASIRGYAELTRRGREEIGPDTRHALGRVESEAGRMTGLVEDLLLLARLDAGRPLEYAEVDLSPLVVDAVSDARALGSDHQWRLELPDEPALVHGDSARLHQVLVNLLGNARHHTPAGTTVTARVLWGGPHTAPRPSPYPAPYGMVHGPSHGPRNHPGDVHGFGPGSPHAFGHGPSRDSPGHGAPPGGGGSGSLYAAPYGSPYAMARAAAHPGTSGPRRPPSYVSLQIEDDGPGIPPDLLPHVFERFARGDASRSRTAGSTGLGLAIVHAVVAAHDGQVTVDSVPGRTVFGVHLPVHQDVTHSQPGHRLTTQP